MKLTLYLLILASLLGGTASLAQENQTQIIKTLKGEPIQGGMIILKLPPESTATLNDAPLLVSPQGLAVLGFHRDDTDAATIIATTKNGETQTRRFTPKPRDYLEQRIDGLPQNMVTPPETLIARIKRDRDMVAMARSPATPISHFAEDFIWPTKGTITGVYGSRRILNGEPRTPHYGIDIAAPKGQAVKAPQSGIIRMVADLYFTGWTIIIDHGHGVSSTFLHLEDTAVIPGDTVLKGQKIGAVGSSGRSTGPHLDWRVNLFDKRLDPMFLVSKMPQ